MISRRLLTLAAVPAIALAGGGAALAGSASPATVTTAAATAPIYTACVKGTTIVAFYKGSHGCAIGQVRDTWNQTGPRGPQGVQGLQGIQGNQGVQGPPGSPGSDAILTVSAQTQLTNWPEGSGWGNDFFTRLVTLTRQHAAPAADCGATATSCWFYTETLSDNGHTVPVDGHASPNGSSADTVTAANITGISTTGGGKLEFYASSDAPNPILVPGTASSVPVIKTQEGVASGATTNWFRLFFPAGTQFGFTSAGGFVTYDWNYAASVSYVSSGTTVSCSQTWNDAINPGDDGQGSVAVDGNITGICPTS